MPLSKLPSDREMALLLLQHAFQLNEELETGLCLLCAEDLSSLSSNLVWVKYARNSLPPAATVLSPFQAAYNYQPPLFSTQDLEALVPSTLALVRRQRQVWRRPRTMSSQSYTGWANRKRCPAPPYCISQRVWLSTKDLPITHYCYNV